MLSWHGKHLRWSTAIQLSCQSWWELQHNSSPGFSSRDREAILQLNFPRCSPYIFHLFSLCTSGFPIPAPILQWSSEPEPCATSDWKLKPGNLPWIQVSWEAWSLFIKVCKPSGTKDFLDSQSLQDVPNKGKKRSEQAEGNTTVIELFDIFLTGKISLWKTQLLKIIGFFLPLNRGIFLN